MSLATYHEFIRSKGQHAAGHGFSCSGKWDLFPHQLATLRFACERGRSAWCETCATSGVRMWLQLHFGGAHF